MCHAYVCVYIATTRRGLPVHTWISAAAARAAASRSGDASLAAFATARARAPPSPVYCACEIVVDGTKRKTCTMDGRCEMVPTARCDV